MGSLYLNNLSEQQRDDLIQKLYKIQNGNCFICTDLIDLQLHCDSIDIDHIEPIKTGGKDDPSNFGLTHSSCNRSKQASDLRVAKVLARFNKIRDSVAPQNRGPNLNDILHFATKDRFELPLSQNGNTVKVSLSDLGQNEVLTFPLYKDDLSGLDYFFFKLPIQYLWHDDRINPRSIGNSLNGLVEEFHRKRPQLHIALGWTELKANETRARIRVFDGQHKATAQILLGASAIPLRIFLNPNVETLLTANTNAGTTLRQIAFDKSVQRHLGNAMFRDRLEKFRKDRGLPADDETFSETDLVNHFRGEWREMRRYIIDATRDSIMHEASNKLKDFVDFAGKGKERPLSYSTIEKTFYSFFIYGDLLETPLNHRIEEGENPRELEKQQILRFMNVVAEKLYIGEFDFQLGTARVENKVQKGEEVPDGHLRCIRLCREEIIYSWLRFVRHIVQNYFIMNGKPIQEAKLFQYRFPEPLWDNLENFLDNLKHLPLWINRDLSSSVFGGKQNYDYWNTIFETGKTPQGQQVLPSGIDLMRMIQPSNAFKKSQSTA